MRRFIFAAVVYGGVPAAARAQAIPARDLLDFPVGTLAEPAALAATMGDGVWNPATIVLPRERRLRVGLAALSTSADQGVSAQAVAVSVATRAATTVSIGILRASVRDLLRTETDPQTLGEITYGTTMASVAVARRWTRITAGVATRFRVGELDGHKRSGVGLDAGVVAGNLGLRDLRVAASSYLWRPVTETSDRPALAFATDLRLAGTNESSELRSGYSVVATERLGREQYLHAAGRSGRLALRGGVVRGSAYGVVTWGSRLGLGLHYARYVVGLSREESDGGIPPSYQFTLTSSFQ